MNSTHHIIVKQSLRLAAYRDAQSTRIVAHGIPFPMNKVRDLPRIELGGHCRVEYCSAVDQALLESRNIV